MDVFRRQMTNEVISLLKENNIILIRVPANMTHIFQPLDLTVNQWAKKFMRDRFLQWYAGVIRQHLDEGKILEVEIKFPLNVMKPLHATWIIEMYNEINLNPPVVRSGWKAAGILDAVQNGARKLSCIDPFFEIDNLNFSNEVNLGNTFIDIDEDIRVLQINPSDDENIEGNSDWEDDEN